MQNEPQLQEPLQAALCRVRCIMCDTVPDRSFANATSPPSRLQSVALPTNCTLTLEKPNRQPSLAVIVPPCDRNANAIAAMNRLATSLRRGLLSAGPAGLQMHISPVHGPVLRSALHQSAVASARVTVAGMCMHSSLAPECCIS